MNHIRARSFDSQYACELFDGAVIINDHDFVSESELKGLKMLQKDVRQILAEHSKLSVDIDQLDDDSNLYDAGLTSLTTVNVMLAIEDHFDIEFEDAMLSRATFQSIDSLVDAVETLLEA